MYRRVTIRQNGARARGLILLISVVLLIFGKEKIGLGLGSIGLVVALVGVNLIQFYIDQFSTVVKAFIQFLILYTMYYYQRRFRARARVNVEEEDVRK